MPTTRTGIMLSLCLYLAGCPCPDWLQYSPDALARLASPARPSTTRPERNTPRDRPAQKAGIRKSAARPFSNSKSPDGGDKRPESVTRRRWLWHESWAEIRVLTGPVLGCQTRTSAYWTKHRALRWPP